MSELNQNPDQEENMFLKLPTQTQGVIIAMGFVLALVALLIARGLMDGDDDGIELGEAVS